MTDTYRGSLQGDPSLARINTGYTPNPAGVRAIVAQLSHPGPLAAAAPNLMGDGATGDLMPYLAWYEVEVAGDDGSAWKPKGEEPPYNPQTGNNCTSEGLMHCTDLLQCVDAAAPPDGASDAPRPRRTCVEATYAFGLFKADMRGDNGCYGAPMAKAAQEIGTISYRDAGEPYEESGSRLRQWAGNPAAIVSKYKDVAAKARVGEPVQITTPEEARAWLANRGLITIASDVGFNVPRDEKGICRRAGSWAHQMAIVGAIDSDGTDTFVVCQSWGKNNPRGPQPFRLPSFCFRITRDAFQAILASHDTWGIRNFPGFERQPLPSRWVNTGWGR